MPSHDKHEPADWEKWGDMLSAELWVAVALSLDIEPGSLLIDWRDADYSDPFEDCPCEFKRRMAIALNYAKNGALPLTSLAFTDPPFSTIRLKDFADWAESSLGWSLPDRFPRNKKDAPWAGDDPKLWPPEAREKLARVEAEERDLRDRLRQQYEAALKELDRVPLSQALRMAAEAGKTDPWRWVMAKIRDGDLRAWGTVGNAHDRPLELPWLDHVSVFADDDGHPKPPTDDCLWFEPGGSRPRRFSDIAVDAGALTELLPAAGGADPMPTPTGMPGRPSKGKGLIEDEFKRRIGDGVALPDLADEAQALWNWYKVKDPKAERPTVKTIKNNIRADHREWMASRRQTDTK
jgi:hypothetical protein